MPGEESDLRELIADARRGDRAAQDEIFVRYRNYLSLLARVSLSRTLASKLDASDVVQDVFIRAHRGFPEFRGESPEELGGWFRSILSNRLADVERQYAGTERKVHRERSLEEILDRSSHALAGFPADRGTSPSQRAVRKEAGAIVADALAVMADADREVIVLRSLEQREWSEIGRRMNRSPQAARQLWGRACQRLGAQLEARRCDSR